MAVRSEISRRMLLVVLVAGLVAVGCAKQLPQQVTDVNSALGQAKDACAGVYAADDLQDVQGRVDAMNDLADEKKYKKARKAAEPLLPEVASLNSGAESAKAEAKQKAEAAVKAAQSKLDAASSAQAASLTGSTYGTAKSKLDAAQANLGDPCKYGEAAALAAEAGQAADMAREQAVAEKRRREEEERRRAEEERRRRGEEARRAEEERLKIARMNVKKIQATYGVMEKTAYNRMGYAERDVGVVGEVAQFQREMDEGERSVR